MEASLTRLVRGFPLSRGPRGARRSSSQAAIRAPERALSEAGLLSANAVSPQLLCVSLRVYRRYCGTCFFFGIMSAPIHLLVTLNYWAEVDPKFREKDI